jgi:hypothetical protein
MAQSSLPPGSIDGAANPGKIPDVVAFRLFLGSLVEKGGAPTAATSGVGSSAALVPTARQRAKLLPAGLGGPDTVVVLRNLQAWQAAFAAANSAAAGQASVIDPDGLTQLTMGALQQQMSPAGFASLLAHVRAEKKNMKIIPGPNMGPA